MDITELIESSKTFDNGESVKKDYHLRWISYSELTDIKSIEHSTGNQPTYYATYEQAKKRNYHDTRYKLVEMLLLGTRDGCTYEFITEFARIHSLPTHKYNKPPNINQFRRYSKWLKRRNKLIKGFTSHNDKYYLVAKRHFHNFYSRYRFCSACMVYLRS